MVRQQNLHVRIGYEEDLQNFAGEKRLKMSFTTFKLVRVAVNYEPSSHCMFFYEHKV